MTSPKLGHKEVFVPELDCGIDEQVISLVRWLNSVPYIRTVSSCQGNPGEITGEPNGGFYGRIAFRAKVQPSRDLLFAFLFEKLVGKLAPAKLGDDVALELVWCAETGYTGWLYFRNEAIPGVCEILGIG